MKFPIQRGIQSVASMLLLAAIHLLSLPAQALEGKESREPREDQPPTWIVSPSVFASSDNDHFKIARYSMGVGYKPGAGQGLMGIRFTRLQYDADAWNESGQRLDLTFDLLDPNTGHGIQLVLGRSQVAGDETTLGELAFSTSVSDRVVVNASVSKDWVESERGIQESVDATGFNLGIEFQATERLLLIGLLGQEDFSDHNQRHHQRVRAIYDVFPDLGIAAHWRYRRFQTDDISTNYFSPDRYHEQMLLLSLRRRVEGWMWYLIGGVGRQTVGTEASTQTKLVEVLISSPVRRSLGFDIRAGYGDSANAQSADYRHRYLQASLRWSF